MKHLILIITCIVAGWSGCKGEPEEQAPALPRSPRVAAPADLIHGKDGRMYFQNEPEPFTGVMKAVYPDGTSRIEFPHTHGLLDGRLRIWHPNGQLKMEAHYNLGRQHGNRDEWDLEGLHTVHRMFEQGKLVHENMPAEFARQMESVISRRNQLDQTVWREETAAQQAEDVFVKLWDDLRAARDKYLPLSKLVFSKITLPVEAEMHAVDWGIREHMLSAGTETLGADEWCAWLEGWKKKGWRIVETEWHQEKFSLGKGAPESLFKIVVHAQRENHRAILRGELEVHWAKVAGKFQVDVLKVLSARVLEREGAAPFAAHQKILTQAESLGSCLPMIVKDINGDGLPEILLPGANEVHWNRGGWKFERMPLFSHYPTELTAGVAADFNGDGRVDIFGLPQQGQPWLYVADDNGRFIDQPQAIRVSVTELEGHSAVTAGDVDGDNDLDIWVMQYKFPYVRGQFPTPYYDANDGHPSYLLLNDGHGKFTEATDAAGLAPKNRRRTYSGSFVDFDGDGDLDLLNVSDFAGLDLYLNNGKGKFTDITEQLGDTRFSFGMSHALGDFNGDGRLDLYMTGMGSTTARRLEAMGAGRAEYTKHQVHRMKMGYGNRLYLGGEAGFKQSPDNDAVSRAGWCWGVTSADFDLDGDRDIYVANGHISRKSCKDQCSVFWRHDIYTNSSTDNTVMNEFFSSPEHGRISNSWNGFEHNVFYLNAGQGRFENVAFLLGVSHEFDARMVVSADFDADGLPDLLVAELNGLETDAAREVLHLHRNQWPAKGNWIGARLRGAPGLSPLGAVVTVKAAGRTWSHPVVAGDSLWSQHPAIVHFGLGKTTTVDSLEIRWPAGKRTFLENPKLNQYHSTPSK